MRIVFFTRQGFDSDELFLYMHARVSSQHADCSIVAVRQDSRQQGLQLRLKRHGKKLRQLGLARSMEIASSYPLQLHYAERDRRERDRLLRRLPRPAAEINQDSVRLVGTVNGPDAVSAIGELKPDVILQAGAGILRRQVFGLSRIATLNLHHGITPAIRGMNSIYWALWEDRPEWIGATVHQIDQGIDTGGVLAYAPIQQIAPDEAFPSLFVRATEQGVDKLLEVLSRLANGERWSVPPPRAGSAYRSTISGWKLAALARRLRSRRKLYSRQTHRQAAES